VVRQSHLWKGENRVQPSHSMVPARAALDVRDTEDELPVEVLVRDRQR
jgi:hypothetical protein